MTLASFIKRFSTIFRPSSPVPQQYKQVFFHLYMDMAWMGVVSGTIMAFIGVYATRQGASPGQIGLLSAVPGLVNLLFALPAGSWLSRHSIGKSVFWASALARIFYFFLIPLPLLFGPREQVWVIIVTTFLMTIPGTALVVGFNSLFADLVPVEWRGHVVGIRNALLSVVATVFTLVSGEALNRITFPLGYQIIFGLGFLGAALSSLHLYILANKARFIRLPETNVPGLSPAPRAAGRRLTEEINNLYRRGVDSLRLDVMRGGFGRIMALLFGWHFFQFMTMPCVTPYIVNELKISDQLIGISTGLFNLTMFLGSLVLSQFAARHGNKKTTGLGIMLLSFFPILTAFGVVPYIIANIVGGVGFALLGGGLYNYLLEKLPNSDRPAYLAWYNLVSNAAILIGSLSGPAVGGVIGIATALVIFGMGRFLAGVAILRWG